MRPVTKQVMQNTEPSLVATRAVPHDARLSCVDLVRS